jgi:hypothetical protein
MDHEAYVLFGNFVQLADAKYANYDSSLSSSQSSKRACQRGEFGTSLAHVSRKAHAWFKKEQMNSKVPRMPNIFYHFIGKNIEHLNPASTSSKRSTHYLNDTTKFHVS